MLHTLELLTQLGVEQIAPQQRAPTNLRVDGEELGLAEVVGDVVSVVVVVVEVVIVDEGHVVVLLVQWTRDVELLVDDLWMEEWKSGVSVPQLQANLCFRAGLWRLTEMRKNTMQVREKPLV